MEKIVRVYYTSFIDVPCESENFSNEKEMIDWANDNTSDFLSTQEIIDNLTKDDTCQAEVVDLQNNV